MAQFDTGLGWSAKEEWLKSATGLVGSINTYTSNILHELPVATTREELITTGLVISKTFGGSYWVYVGADISGIFINPISGTSPFDTELYCALNTGTVYWYFYDPVAQRDWPYGPQAHARVNNSVIVDNVQWYYEAISPNNDLLYSEYSYPRETAIRSITHVSENFYKLYAGYTVSAIAKWASPDGVIHSTMLQISSDIRNAFLSHDGTTLADDYHTYHGLLGGRVFHMVYINSDEAPISPAILIQSVDLTPYSVISIERVFSTIVSQSFANVLLTAPPPDPYGDTAEEDGGGGEEQDDEPVEEQTNSLPSVAGLGFCTVYVPSQSELLAMSSYLWSGSFDVTQVIKLFSNPLDSILGLSAVPVDLVGTSEQIYLGGVALTGVTMPRYTGRTAVKVDMGSATISERYGAYLDYDPYTEFAIYVPFVGIKNLKADDIMGKTLSLMYDIDILTGACVAYLRPSGGSVLYEWAGQCAQQIPVTASNWDNIFRNAMTAATTLGTSFLAPASAPVLAGAVASAAAQAIAAKPRVDRSGALTGVSGWLGQLRPYIIRTIPEAYIPADQNKFIGYPAYINVTMSAISGYNEVASVHLEGIPATGNELAEIESLLKGGVIF